MLRCYISLLLVSVMALPASSQHFMTGAWEGNYSKGFLTSNPKKLRVDLTVSDDGTVAGSTHLYYPLGFYEHYTVSGRWNAQDSTIFFSEDSTLGLHLGFGAGNCTGNYTMRLTVRDTVLRLEGRWKDNQNTLFGCGSMGVWLEKPFKRKPPTTSTPTALRWPL